MQLRRRCTDEYVRNSVLPRIAALQMSYAVVLMARCRVVLMNGKPVVVLGVIVIVIGMRVEQRRHTERRDQRRNEQQCCGAVHQLSL